LPNIPIFFKIRSHLLFISLGPLMSPHKYPTTHTDLIKIVKSSDPVMSLDYSS